MRKIIKICLITAASLFLFLTLNLLFMPKYIEEDNDGRITAEFEREKLNNDVLFVGSSLVCSDINPIVFWEKYGIASFDRSTPSQPAWTSYYLIKDALESTDPQFIAFDVSFMRYEDDYAEEPSNRKAFDGMRISRTKFEAIKAAKSPEESYIDYVIPLFRFHSRWQYLKNEDFKYLYYKPYVTANGYLYSDNVAPISGERRSEGLSEVRLSNRNAEYLEKIINICKDNDVQLMLFKTPTYHPKWDENFDADIRFYADKYGIEYCDYDQETSLIGLDFATDFVDEGNHMNVFGAEKFSTYLGQHIKDHYDVVDHRGDPTYEKVWQEKCERYYNGH